jgi:ACR3 family arsenite transporter
MTEGDANYTLVQVSMNDLIMVMAFASIVAFLLGIINIVAQWETMILLTVLYAVISLTAGVLTRPALIR